MKVNLSAYRGDDVDFPFTFKDANEAPIDITGWAIFFTLKNSLSDPDASAVLKKDVTTHSDPVNGMTTVPLNESETNTLSGDYFYDFQYKDDTGEIKTIMSGTFAFLVDVTQRIIPE